MSNSPMGMKLVTADGAGQARLVQGGPGTPLRHHFTVSTHIFNSSELNLQATHRVLLLTNDLSGHPELSDIVIQSGGDAEDRVRVLMELLGLARDLLRATSPSSLRTSFLTVELPGELDKQGRSPFLLGLGHHFLPGELSELRACGTHLWCTRLAPMLPRQVLYSSILDPEAQRSLGQIRDDQAWLMEALLELGFMPYRRVGIDYGGPVLISRC